MTISLIIFNVQYSRLKFPRVVHQIRGSDFDSKSEPSKLIVGFSLVLPLGCEAGIAYSFDESFWNLQRAAAASLLLGLDSEVVKGCLSVCVCVRAYAKETQEPSIPRTKSEAPSSRLGVPMPLASDEGDRFDSRGGKNGDPSVRGFSYTCSMSFWALAKRERWSIGQFSGRTLSTFTSTRSAVLTYQATAPSPMPEHVW